MRAVNQHDTFLNQPHIFMRLTAKAGGGYKDSLAGLVQIQGTCEGLDLGTPDGFVGVALGLQVDGVEPQPVFLDDAIDCLLYTSDAADEQLLV